MNPNSPQSGHLPDDPPEPVESAADAAETTPREEAALDAALAPEPVAVAEAEAAEPGGFIGVLFAIRRVLTAILAVICLVLFVFLVLVVSWQVFTREVMNNAAPWTTEVAQYTFVILAIFAAAYVFGERGHIAVEMLVERFPRAGQKVFAVLIELVVAFFIGMVFILGGWLVAQGSWNQSLSTVPLTIGMIYTVMPVAGAIILFFSFTRIVTVLTGTEEAFPVLEEMGEAV